MLRFILRPLSLLALAIVTFGFASHTSAQTKPYQATGFAQFAANQSDFSGGGHATHLGLYTEVGRVTLTPTSTPGVLAIDGWARYTAANGDELHAAVSGILDARTGAITGTATYIGGSGRFELASGTSVLTGQMVGAGALVISALGDLAY